MDQIPLNLRAVKDVAINVTKNESPVGVNLRMTIGGRRRSLSYNEYEYSLNSRPSFAIVGKVFRAYALYLAWTSRLLVTFTPKEFYRLCSTLLRERHGVMNFEDAAKYMLELHREQLYHHKHTGLVVTVKVDAGSGITVKWISPEGVDHHIEAPITNTISLSRHKKIGRTYAWYHSECERLGLVPHGFTSFIVGNRLHIPRTPSSLTDRLAHYYLSDQEHVKVVLPDASSSLTLQRGKHRKCDKLTPYGQLGLVAKCVQGHWHVAPKDGDERRAVMVTPERLPVLSHLSHEKQETALLAWGAYLTWVHEAGIEPISLREVGDGTLAELLTSSNLCSAEELASVLLEEQLAECAPELLPLLDSVCMYNR